MTNSYEIGSYEITVEQIVAYMGYDPDEDDPNTDCRNCPIDWLQKYTADAVSDPFGPDSGEDRMIRGGSFQTMPASLRLGYRLWYAPISSMHIIGGGLRIARTVQ